VSRTTVRAELSGAATVRLLVVDARGRIVRTLVPSVSRDAGAFTQDWDRRDDRGRKVKAGGYAVQLDATDAAGARVTASTDIRVV
jgi:flagellar hook assembly protein FlgD